MGGLVIYCAFLLRTFWYVLPPNYRSDPPDQKLNSALLLSRRAYPPQGFVEFPFLNCVGGNLPKLGR